jgi:hypothetical protein
MKPEADQILSMSAGQIMAGVLPLLPDSYSQGSTALLSFLMLFSAQEYERGAEIRSADNAAMRAAFGALAPVVRDTDLKKKLEDATLSPDSSLLISALNRSNAHLRALLIELHAHLEAQDGGAARAGEKRIWGILKASAAARLVTPPGG